MTLCRLIYKSQYSEPITQKLLQSIEAASVKNNEAVGVTGILIGNKTGFMQVLEGENQVVNQLFHRICMDERHQAIELISFDQIVERQFSSWSMKCVAVGLMGRIIAQRLKQKYGESEADLVLPSDSHKAFALLYDLAFLLKSGEIGQHTP
jgi:hypothetical protein